MKIQLSFFLIVFFLNYNTSKVVKDVLTMNPSSTRHYFFQPIAYFTCDIGQCSYKIDLEIPGEAVEQPNFKVLVFLDNYWDEVLSLQASLTTKDKCQKIQDLKNIVQEVRWNQDQSKLLKASIQGQVRQSVRPHVWYFVVVENCEDDKKQYKDLIEIKAQIQINQPNSSQFSYEEYGIKNYYYILLLLNTIFLIYAIFVILKSYKKDEQLDQALAGMLIVLFIATISVLLKSIELTFYAQDGCQRPFLRGLQVMMETLTGFLVTIILIFLGLGWTVLFNSITQYKFFLPSIASFAALQMAIFILTKLFANKTSFQYHDYQGALGILLAIIRLVLYSIFVYSVLQTYSKVKQRIRKFIIKLSIYGSVYFLTFPLLLLIVELVVADYWKFSIIMIGTFALQEVAIMLLINLFLAKNTEYYKISLKSHSPLPCEKMD